MIVAGIVLRIEIIDQVIDLLPPLSGPAIFSAIGAVLHGSTIRLLTALPIDMSEYDILLIQKLDPEGSLIRKLPRPSLRLKGPSIFGNGRFGKMIGDPSAWQAQLPPDIVTGEILVMANGDPDWHREILNSYQPSFISMDVHGEWIAYRTQSLFECLRRSHLVTITAHDLNKLPPKLLSCIDTANFKNKILIVKNGNEGICVSVNGQSQNLPAPILQNPLVTDIGAGDLLLGAITACLCRQKTIFDLNSVSHAYKQCSPTIAALLESINFTNFVNKVML